MNHAFNVTIEHELNNKTAFSIAYVGTKGRDLVNFRDLNACPVSTLTCDTTRQPFGAQFPNYNHILQLNNDGYSNYNSLQLAYKLREVHGFTGQVNYTWSRSFDTGSANRAERFFRTIRIPTMSTKATPRPISIRPGISTSRPFMTCQRFMACRR